MANTIITKNSSTASAVPTAGDLVQGELAVNVTDKRLFTEDAGGNIVEIGTNPSTINIDAGTIDGTAIGGTTPTTGAFTTLSASTSVTSPSGLFTNLSASGSVTLSGGTANGVPYLNGSKVLTSGSALTFDGSSFFGGTNIHASGRFYAQRSSSSLYLPIAGYTDGSAGAVLTGAKGDIVAFGNAGGDGVIFANANTEAMRLTSTGLGIGTSSPTNKLSVTGNANITGNTTLGDASTDTVTVNGYMGVGGNAISSAAIYVRNTALSGTTQVGVNSNFTGSSGSTSSIRAFSAGAKTEAASFTTSDVVSFYANNATKGAGSTITNQHGVYIADQTQGTNNYGITSLVSSGTNKWNIYASGTAANYFAGNVGIGNTNTAAFDQVASDDLVIGGGASNHGITIYSATNASGGIAFADGTTTTDQYRGRLQYAHTDDSMRFFTSATERLRLSTTEAVFNNPGNDYDFRVESITGTHALFVEGSSGNTLLGGSSSLTPANRLEVYYDYNTDAKGITITSYNPQLVLKDLSTPYADIELRNSNGIFTISADTNEDGTFETERLRIDSSGNLGLGATPSAWSTLRGLQVGNASLAGFQNFAYLNSNAFYDGSAWKYIATGFAAKYDQVNSAHAWYTAPSGTAGTAISFSQVMTLDANGNLGIGTSSPGDKIELGGNGSGIIIRSPNGTRYRLTVTDLGVLSIAAA